jgi:CBS domain containing-hemolysin-like protein
VTTEVLGVFACIAAGAMLAAVDEALAAFGDARARAAREAGGRDGRAAARYLTDANVIHIRLLTGRIAALVGTAVLAYEVGSAFEDVWARRATVAVAALLYATTIGTSSVVAERRASRIALPLLRWVRPVELLITPFAVPLQWASSLVDRLIPANPEDNPERVTEVVVEHLIDAGEEQGAIATHDAALLKSVLEFKETLAREIMVPRTQMVALEVTMPLPEVIARIAREGHSRYPVYRGSVDHPLGTLVAKDLFKLIEQGKQPTGTLEEYLRTPVVFAAESQRISDLLRQMQVRRMHLAIVVDEYGGTAGMVTLEDVIEEIVGDIRDEHDVEEAQVKQLAPGRFLANAEASLHDVAEITGLRVPENATGYESLGGMLVDLAGRVPRSGESIGIGDHDLIVRAADERRVTRVEVVERSQRLPPAAE